jgi:hypothetical protein
MGKSFCCIPIRATSRAGDEFGRQEPLGPRHRAKIAMAARSLRRASLLGPKPARRVWLKREIAKTDAQLKLLEDHIRRQQERIEELERGW